MSTTIVIDPVVQQFVDAVRQQLADLDAEERREITDGLEADLTEQVVEQGTDVLGDPVAYARELRLAAGLEAAGHPDHRHVRASLSGFLDSCHAWADRRLARVPGDHEPLLGCLRPLWWIVRAWVAVLLVDLVFGASPWSGAQLVPHLRGTGGAVLLLAVLVSVQIGRGKLWPGGRRALPARLVLLTLNAFAIAMTPLVVAQLEHGADEDYWRGYDAGYGVAAADQGPADDAPRAGLYSAGKWVSNVYPYDAAGRPLVGVQLFDQTGEPIEVVSQTECVYASDGTPTDKGRVYYPWSDGAAQKPNAFPVPSRVQGPDTPDPDPLAFQGGDRPTVGQFPFARVPAISLPGLSTSTTETPRGALTPGERPDTPINPIDRGC
jgi:hypothetical protein